MIGRTFSHYRIINTLGEGGMGVVYLAEDTHLHRQVAIKFPTCAPDETAAHRRFLGEARHASRLTHQHIATIYDYGETEDGCPFIVMELVRGESLSDVIARGSLTVARVIEIGIQIAEALEEAHTHGIVHRDIKPSNIRFERRGSIKVLDFGLAKQFDGEARLASDPNAPTLQTESGLLIGTPLYLSPEQFKGAQADARSDLFALGALLYECLAGRPAFSGANFVEIGAQVIHVEPPPLIGIVPGVTPEVEGIIRRLLAKNPATRYQSASEAITDLRHARARLTHDADFAPTLLSQENPWQENLSQADSWRRSKSPSSAPQHSDDAQASNPYLTTALAPHATAPQASDSRLTKFHADESVGARKPALTARTLSMFRRTMHRRLSAGSAIALALGAAALAVMLVWLVLFAWRDAPHVPSAEAARLYEAGVAQLRDGAPYSASKALQRAIEVDPQFALAHARLAEAWTELDYADRAKDALLNANALVPNREALPRRDALHLEAVIAIVMREYDRAAEAYRAVTRIEPNDAGAYVDLGRAFERAEKSPDALAAYAEAIARDGQYATAYLRQGVLHGRAQETDAALAAFNRAAELYDILGNIEGRAETLYQRGAMFDEAKRLADAERELRSALDLSRTTANAYQQIKVLLQLSSITYSQGDTAQASGMAREAIELAQSNDMGTLVARGLVDLGNVYFVNGDYKDAEGYFSQALDIAARQRARRAEARAACMLGNLRNRQGRLAEALPLIGRALAFWEPGGYRREAAQALIVAGRINRSQGDYKGALAAFERLMQAANDADDNALRASAHSALGGLFEDLERYADALRHFEQGYAIEQPLGEKFNIGYTLLNLAGMRWRLGRYAEAETALAEARAIAEQPRGSYKLLRAWTHLTGAQMRLSQRRFGDAQTEADRALALAGVDHKEIAVKAKGVIGAAQAASGANARGTQNGAEALALATQAGDARLLSNAQLRLAEILLAANADSPRAAELARAAQEQFSRHEQHESEWRARLVLNRAAQLGGNDAEAQTQAAHATAAFDRLRQRLASDYVESYLARPDVQFRL